MNEEQKVYCIYCGKPVSSLTARCGCEKSKNKHLWNRRDRRKLKNGKM